MNEIRFISDDAEILPIVIQQGLLGKMEPGPGYDTSSTVVLQDGVRMLIIYNNTPGDSGYLAIAVSEVKWTAQQADSLFAEILNGMHSNRPPRFHEVTVDPL